MGEWDPLDVASYIAIGCIAILVLILIVTVG